jgi:hypothetical protein
MSAEVAFSNLTASLFVVWDIARTMNDVTGRQHYFLPVVKHQIMMYDFIIDGLVLLPTENRKEEYVRVGFCVISFDQLENSERVINETILQESLYYE